MAINGNTTCVVPGRVGPISVPNNLCEDHRLLGMGVRVGGSTMAITACGWLCPQCYDEIDNALKTIGGDDLTVVDKDGSAVVRGRLEDNRL